MEKERSSSRRLLLVGGALAGPLFTAAWLAQGALRVDYDPRRFAISSLSIGELGWVQIGSFMVTGLLVLAFALQLRREFSGLPGSVWGPRLIGSVGVGLIGAGIFVTDPLNGYPPGTPLIPAERTVHGILHDLFGVPFFLGLPVGTFVFGRLFASRREPGWAWYSRLSGIGMLAAFFVARLGFRLLPSYPDLAANFGLLQRITVTVGFAWLTLLAVHLLGGSTRSHLT